MKTIRSNNVFLTLGTSLAFAVLSSAASAATLSTSTILPAASGTGNFTLIPVSGLDQFDPTNGTLTGISLSLAVDSYDINMSLGGWDDPGTGAQFESANLSGQISIDISLPGGGGLLFSSTVFGDTLFDEFESIDLTGSSGGPVTQDATTSLTTNGVFNDFIGTGDVSILQVGIFTFGNPEVVMLDDGSFAEGEPDINSFLFGPSEVTIDYTYTPTAAVPLPATAWLFISALSGLVITKRKQLKS